MNLLELANKYPNKIEFEVDYIVYTYDNFKFYLKRVDTTDEIKSWLSEQPNVLELQKKMSFEDLKSVLEKFLNPEAEGDDEEEEVVVPAKATNAAPKDLPWEDDEEEETPAPKANYALKTAPTKTSKAAKFDALFEDEE